MNAIAILETLRENYIRLNNAEAALVVRACIARLRRENDETRIPAGVFVKDKGGDWRDYYEDENEYKGVPQHWCKSCGARRVHTPLDNCFQCEEKPSISEVLTGE